jgi:hypothetical protein
VCHFCVTHGRIDLKTFLSLIQTASETIRTTPDIVPVQVSICLCYFSLSFSLSLLLAFKNKKYKFLFRLSSAHYSELLQRPTGFWHIFLLSLFLSFFLSLKRYFFGSYVNIPLATLKQEPNSLETSFDKKEGA